MPATPIRGCLPAAAPAGAALGALPLKSGAGLSLTVHPGDPAIGPSIAEIPAQFGLTAIRLHGARTAIRVSVSAGPAKGSVFQKVGVFVQSLFHDLTRRHGAFADARKMFGELRNV